MLNLCAVVSLLSRTPFTADGTVRWCASKGTLTSEMLDAMRRQKAELHALVEEWSERAAIAEYGGGLGREAAERLAWQCLLGEGQQRQNPTSPGCDSLIAKGAVCSSA